MIIFFSKTSINLGPEVKLLLKDNPHIMDITLVIKGTYINKSNEQLNDTIFYAEHNIDPNCVIQNKSNKLLAKQRDRATIYLRRNLESSHAICIALF